MTKTPEMLIKNIGELWQENRAQIDNLINCLKEESPKDLLSRLDPKRLSHLEARLKNLLKDMSVNDLLKTEKIAFDSVE